MSNFKLLLFAFAFVALVVISSFAIETVRHKPAGAVSKPVTISALDLTQTVCYPLDLTASGWRPVTYAMRGRISLYVYEGRADWMESSSLDCYSRDPKEPTLGEKVATLRVEYWRWRKK